MKLLTRKKKPGIPASIECKTDSKNYLGGGKESPPPSPGGAPTPPCTPGAEPQPSAPLTITVDGKPLSDSRAGEVQIFLDALEKDREAAGAKEEGKKGKSFRFLHRRSGTKKVKKRKKSLRNLHLPLRGSKPKEESAKEATKAKKDGPAEAAAPKEQKAAAAAAATAATAGAAVTAAAVAAAAAPKEENAKDEKDAAAETAVEEGAAPMIPIMEEEEQEEKAAAEEENAAPAEEEVAAAPAEEEAEAPAEGEAPAAPAEDEDDSVETEPTVPEEEAAPAEEATPDQEAAAVEEAALAEGAAPAEEAALVKEAVAPLQEAPHEEEAMAEDAPDDELLGESIPLDEMLADKRDKPTGDEASSLDDDTFDSTLEPSIEAVEQDDSVLLGFYQPLTPAPGKEDGKEEGAFDFNATMHNLSLMIDGAVVQTMELGTQGCLLLNQLNCCVADAKEGDENNDLAAAAPQDRECPEGEAAPTAAKDGAAAGTAEPLVPPEVAERVNEFYEQVRSRLEVESKNAEILQKGLLKAVSGSATGDGNPAAVASTIAEAVTALVEDSRNDGAEVDPAADSGEVRQDGEVRRQEVSAS